MNNPSPESDLATIRAIASLDVVIPPHEIERLRARQEQKYDNEYPPKAVIALALGAAVVMGVTGVMAYKLQWESAIQHSPLRQSTHAEFKPTPSPTIKETPAPPSPSVVPGPSSIRLSPVFGPWLSSP